MKAWHCILILLIGYVLGIYFPAVGQSTISKATSLVS